MMWGWSGGMGLWMVLGMGLMLLFWVGVIGLVVWGVAGLTRRYEPGSRSTEGSEALKVAKERYARGEINREEFTQIRRDLS
jgi:putative membrane protein